MTTKEFFAKFPTKGLNDYYAYLNQLEQTNSSAIFEKPSDIRRVEDFNDREIYNYHYSSSNTNYKGPIVLIFSLLVFAASIFTGIYALNVIVLIVIIYGLITACPNCGNWYVRKQLSSDEINRENGFKDVKRVDKHKNMHGRAIGQTERHEQVHTIKITYLNSYCCSRCNFKWQNKSVRETY